MRPTALFATVLLSDHAGHGWRDEEADEGCWHFLFVPRAR